MKISKPQQEVVDKMREGWELRKSNWTPNYWWLSSPDMETITVRYPTAIKLNDLSIIELHEASKSIHRFDIYRLTEQYKTQPDSVTGEK